MSEIVLEIPSPWPLLNKWQRMHWRERSQTTERFAWLIRGARGYKKGAPIQRCAIIADRYHGRSGGHLPDWDNLYAGLKLVLDALVVSGKRYPHGLGIIQDDSPKHIVSLSAHPHIADEAGSRSVIRIIVLDGEG